MELQSISAPTPISKSAMVTICLAILMIIGPLVTLLWFQHITAQLFLVMGQGIYFASLEIIKILQNKMQAKATRNGIYTAQAILEWHQIIQYVWKSQG